MTNSEKNIANTRLLLEKAMPQQDYDLMRSLVREDAQITRAGFSDIYQLTGTDIPSSGNFIEWLEAGWKVLSSGLSDQTSEATDVVASEDTVMIKFHMTALHSFTFSKAEATNRRVEWDEIGVLHFDENGKMKDMWFMCQELSLIQQIGYKVHK